jgi:hypothetical protein
VTNINSSASDLNVCPHFPTLQKDRYFAMADPRFQAILSHIRIYVVCPESNENGFQKNVFIENFYKLM